MTTAAVAAVSSENLQKAYESFIEKEERREPSTRRDYVYASSWSACTRQIALDLLHPSAKPSFSADTLANFRRGNDRARDIKSDMTRVGRECDPSFDVVGAEERFELRDKKGRVCIVGKVDFRLKFKGQRGSAPVEVKSYHPSLTQNVKTFEDMFQNRWLRKGAFQLLAYLLATNEPVGYMLLDRPGIPKILQVVLYEHLHRIEDFLQRAEIALDAKEAAVKDPDNAESHLPDFTEEPSECRVCDFFGSLCNPSIGYAGAKIFTDEDTILKTERFAKLEAMPEIEEHAQLEKWAKNTFRGVLKAIVGKCVIAGKWQRDTKYKIPDDVKEKIDELKAPYAEKVDEGKFFLDVSITE